LPTYAALMCCCVLSKNDEDDHVHLTLKMKQFVVHSSAFAERN